MRSEFYNVEIRFDVYLNGTSYLVSEGQLAREYNDISRQEYRRLQDIFGMYGIIHDGDSKIIYVTDDGEHRFFVYMVEASSYSKYCDSHSLDRIFNPTYNQKSSPLGMGWSFVFDSIEIVSDDSYYNNFRGKTYYLIDKKPGKYLHMENGQVFEIILGLRDINWMI